MNEMRRPEKAFTAEARAEPDGSLVVWDGLFGFLKRRKHTIIGTALAVTVLGTAAILAIPWSYKATAIVTLNAYPAIPENPNLQTPIPQTERMQREIQGLLSRALAAHVIGKLRLDRNAEFDPDQAGNVIGRIGAWLTGFASGAAIADTQTPAENDAIRRSAVVDIFMAKLTVTPVLTSEQIEVTFSSRDPRTAYRAANGVVDSYIETAMDRRRDALQKAADALQDRISSVRDELRDLPVGAGGANTIERQLEAKRTLLQAYIAKLGELLLLKSAIEPRILVQSRAVYPRQRAGVPIALGIPVLVVAGLLLGAGAGLIQEGRQSAVSNAAQLEGITGLRPIGVAAGDRGASDRVLTAEPRRLERACERIAMELLMVRERDRGTVVVFAAPSPNEAKSAICLGVARALARSGHRTLAINANVSRSQAHARLAAKAKATPGDERAATAEADLELRSDPSHALDILAAGLGPDATTAAYEKTVAAMQRLAPAYEFALLDIAAVGTNPEARYLARHADLAVLVVRCDHDRRDAVRDAAAQIGANGVAIVGGVLTRGTFERGMLSWAADRLGLRG